ncbi:hypothetical protein COCON_G00218420 [Conger conger]|uniref:Uncharacterized protein n=1 Tax=Conger conger TaxID=82655 RepID=A0A9Q1HPA3_CONCO|nr:hypothetical protein COCON_G00218420 [Conger conger]
MQLLENQKKAAALDRGLTTSASHSVETRAPHIDRQRQGHLTDRQRDKGTSHRPKERRETWRKQKITSLRPLKHVFCCGGTQARRGRQTQRTRLCRAAEKG